MELSTRGTRYHCKHNLPITEIAEKVGYIDVTHFGRLFRKHTGQSPSTYRTQGTDGENYRNRV